MQPAVRKLYAPVRTANERRLKDLVDAVEKRNPERYKRQNKNRKIK